jgi:hypothetical protein
MGHATPDALLNLAVQVVLQFVVEFVLDSFPAEQRPEAKPNLCEQT